MSLLTIIKLKIYSKLEKFEMFKKTQHKRNIKKIIFEAHKEKGKDVGLIETKNGLLFVSFNEETKEVYVAFDELNGYDKPYDNVPLLKNNEFSTFKGYSVKTTLK